MDASASALNADDRANELYWSSGLSVNQIAEALDLSKGALYEMIRPLAASVACPSCGAEAVHPNRTAKEKGLIACPECGWGGKEGAAAAPAAAGNPKTHAPAASGAARATERPSSPPASPTHRPPHAPTRRPGALAGGILLGAAAGLALILWARRK